jgi:hypothetical protein
MADPSKIDDRLLRGKAPAANEPPAAVVERLESLDDVILPAIEGDEAALAACEPAWRQAVAELGPAAVSESRGEYLRYARSVWEYLRVNAPQHRRQLFAVMKIILLLSGVDS